jgi:Leu/Phe-tRNA-protein transferase
MRYDYKIKQVVIECANTNPNKARKCINIKWWPYYRRVMYTHLTTCGAIASCFSCEKWEPSTHDM